MRVAAGIMAGAVAILLGAAGADAQVSLSVGVQAGWSTASTDLSVGALHGSVYPRR
jgi:hypothetical protein